MYFEGGELVKKIYQIPTLLLSLITLTGFSYSVISTLKDSAVDLKGKIIVTSVCLLGLIGSFVAICRIIKDGFKEKEIDEAEEDLRREEAYKEWQKTLAEAEAKCEEAREKWEEYQKTFPDPSEESDDYKAEIEAET